MNRVSNGRIDIQSPDTKSLFNMNDKIPAHQCTTYRNPLEGQWDDSALSNAYFSKEMSLLIAIIFLPLRKSFSNDSL